MATENPFCTLYSLHLFCSPRFGSFSLCSLDSSYPSYPFYLLCSSPLTPSVLSILSVHPSFILSVFSPLSAFLYPPYLHISSRSDPPRSSHFAFSPALTPSFGFIGYTSEESGRFTFSNNLFSQNRNKNSRKMSSKTAIKIATKWATHQAARQAAKHTPKKAS